MKFRKKKPLLLGFSSLNYCSKSKAGLGFRFALIFFPEENYALAIRSIVFFGKFIAVSGIVKSGALLILLELEGLKTRTGRWSRELKMNAESRFPEPMSWTPG